MNVKENFNNGYKNQFLLKINSSLHKIKKMCYSKFSYKKYQNRLFEMAFLLCLL